MVREIYIIPVLNGFVCKVGCQTIVFTTLANMTAEIERYYENPNKTEKEYINKAVNRTIKSPEPEPEPV